MILLLKLGWRNMRRRRWRSWLTMGMFFFGSLMMVIAVAMNEGSYADMIRIATRSWSGDFQVMFSGYNDKPELYKTIPWDTANGNILLYGDHPPFLGSQG